MFEHKSTIIYPQTERIEQGYPFELIDGYDTLRIETFSVSLPFIKAFSTKGGPKELDVIFGKGDMLLTENVKIRAALLGKRDDSFLLRWLSSAQTREPDLYMALTSERFRLWTAPAPSHTKMFLCENASGGRRAIVGSANASLPSMCGDIEECVVVFDEGPICDKLFTAFDIKKNAAGRVELAQALAWLDKA